MNYRSVADLNNAIIKALPMIPQDIDVVVGIPRSGMLPATLIALFLHRPLTDLNGLISGYLLNGGQRMPVTEGGSKFRKALVVEDSVATGWSLAKARRMLADNPIDTELVFAAVFVEPAAKYLVDIAFEMVESPRIFEWNMFNSYLIPYSCVDIDGVLCRDPTDEENDDGPKYLHFIETVPANFVPSARIGHLVTSRLEKYRAQTEEWLRRNYIQYGELHMMQYETAEIRREANAYADYKAKIYMDTWSDMFIESNADTAVEIARKAMKPVYCTDAGRMYRPGEAASEGLRAAAEAADWQLKYFIRKAKNNASSIVWENLLKLRKIRYGIN